MPRQRERRKGYGCPGCCRRFAGRAFMLSHALYWPACRRVIPRERIEQMEADYRRLTASFPKPTQEHFP